MGGHDDTRVISPVAPSLERRLLEASRAVAQLTDLPAALHRISEVALGLVDARYAALGVDAPDGSLEQFVRVGEEPLDVSALLSAPIRVRGEEFGTIHVGEPSSGAFTDEDRQLLTALALTAGVAIDNARLLEETRRRQRWAEAGAEVVSSLLTDETGDALGLIAERVVGLADAKLVSVILAGAPGHLVVETSRGELADRIHRLTFRSAGTLSGRALESGQPVMAETNEMADATPNPWIELGPTMAIPLGGSAEPHGVLTVSRARGARLFTPAEVDMAADFAGQASVALALTRARENQERLVLIAERARIARDLHDHVIQRLFAAGLGLRALDTGAGDKALRAGIDTTVRALDDSIADIRAAIFALVPPDAREPRTLRHRVMDVVTEASSAMRAAPRVVFAGAVDLVVPDALVPDLLAVVRESLANVARHADATETLVSVVVTDDDIVLEITDDGVGIAADSDGGHRSSGTANLRRRALELGGDSSLHNTDSGGARLRWSVPLTTKGR
jgi:signal transduction histidine kinase